MLVVWNRAPHVFSTSQRGWLRTSLKHPLALLIIKLDLVPSKDHWMNGLRGLLIQFFGDEKETQFPNESNPNDGRPYGGATGKGASTNGVTRPGVWPGTASVAEIRLVISGPNICNPKNHWMLLWSGLNMYSSIAGVWDLQTTSFEIPWFLGKKSNMECIVKWFGSNKIEVIY